MDKMYSAKYGEYLASIFGACLVAFGLGILLADYFGGAAPFLIMAGIVLHAWGMYRSHIRNRG